MRWVVRWRNRHLTVLFKLFTYSGKGKAWFATAVALVLLQALKIPVMPDQARFLRSMLYPLIAWGLGSTIKKLVARERPSEVIPNYSAIIERPACRSFPSTHAASSVAFFVALAVTHHPLAWIIGVWALFVNLSRFYLGVHFPTDLLGGGILGCLCGLLPAAIRDVFK